MAFDLQEKIQEKLNLRLKQEKKLRLCVASSAGVDSTVLLHALVRLKESIGGFDLAVAHVNFGLRGEESEKDQLFLEELCKKNGLELFTFKPLKTKKVALKIGLQEWARKQRYEFFESLALDNWTVALAHTSDDLVENFIFRLARGTSPLSSLGMKEVYKNYWRPCLDVKKSDLIFYAEKHRIQWREDRTNASKAYSRNRVRHDVVPTLEDLSSGASKRILRFAEESRDLASFVRDSLKEKLLKESFKGPQETQVSLEFFKGLNQGVSCLVLADLIREFSHGQFVPEHKCLLSLYKLISSSVTDAPKRQICTDMFCKISENKLIFMRL